MNYAIRFVPIDPKDPSPALYLSAGPHTAGARLTSVASDLWCAPRSEADDVLAEDWSLDVPRYRSNLRADVVPLADAIADLTTPETTGAKR